MKAIIYLTLFLSIICSNLRNKNKPSSSLRKCLKKIIGEGQYNPLYESFKSFSKTNSEVTLPEYIKANEPDLSRFVDQCAEKEKNNFKNRIKEKMSRKNIERLNERIDKLEQKQQVEERKYDDMKDD